MDLLQLLDAIDTTGLHIDVVAGQLHLTGPARARGHVRAAVTEHRDFLIVYLQGFTTGHLIGFCDTCREPTLTAALAPGGKTRTRWPTCRLTPACPGRHQPRPTDLARYPTRTEPDPTGPQPNPRPGPTEPTLFDNPTQPPRKENTMNTDPATIAETIAGAAELTAALDAHRVIPDPGPVHEAADHLRTVTAGTFFALLGAAVADAADHRVADSTVDTHAADAEFDRLLDRLALRCRIERSKHLDAIDVTQLSAEQVDAVADAYQWVNGPDGPPSAA